MASIAGEYIYQTQNINPKASGTGAITNEHVNNGSLLVAGPGQSNSAKPNAQVGSAANQRPIGVVGDSIGQAIIDGIVLVKASGTPAAAHLNQGIIATTTEAAGNANANGEGRIVGYTTIDAQAYYFWDIRG